MLHRIIQTALVILAVVLVAPLAPAQNITRDYDDDNYQYRDDDNQYRDRGRIDRYLDAEVWTNHNDGEYYEGDNIVIHYRVNRDAFVVIYTVDTRGRVNILFPANPTDDNFVNGGTTYHLPSDWDDYDLVITGPEGVENIQIIASRERIPIPDWYPVSGIICDWDDRHEFLDYINDRHFVRYDGQRFAYDRTSIYVDEWEEYYFQPVYHPVYHNWTLCGNVYLDYPFGSTVYINGVYWGCTPLYLPRVYVGWNTFTIYDRWGYCWESDVHVSRYHTVVLNNEIIKPRPSVQSKFKEVRHAGYRNPEANGYPKFAQKKTAILNSKVVTKKNIVLSKGRSGKVVTEVATVAPKKNVKGSTSLVKTERGWETTGLIGGTNTKIWSRGKSSQRSVTVDGLSKSGSKGNYRTKDFSPKSTGDYRSNKSQRSTTTIDRKLLKTSLKGKSVERKTVIRKNESSGYYQKKSSGKHNKNKDSKSYQSKSRSSSSQKSPQQKSGSVKNTGNKSSGKSSQSTVSKSKSSGSKSKGKGRH